MDRILKIKMRAEKKANDKKTEKHPFLVVLFSVFVALLVWFYVQDAEAPYSRKSQAGRTEGQAACRRDTSRHSCCTVLLRMRQVPLLRVLPLPWRRTRPGYPDRGPAGS